MIKTETIFRWVTSLCLLAWAGWLGGCASPDGPDSAGQLPAAAGAEFSTRDSNSHGKGSTQHHLLTPESNEDLSVLSDAEIETRMVAKRREIGRHMNDATNYMIDHIDRDLSSDRTYHQMLRRAKQADTDLNLLEREVARRAARAKAS